VDFGFYRQGMNQCHNDVIFPALITILYLLLATFDVNYLIPLTVNAGVLLAHHMTSSRFDPAYVVKRRCR